jgi:hypothetical protein
VAGVPASAPSITIEPLGQVVVRGAEVTLKVAATDISPLKYQWQFNGVNLPGATNSTLTVPNVQASQAGQYVVVVSSDTGVTSPAAMLSVISPAAIELSISKPSPFQLHVSAPAGQNVVLQASTNLTDWLSLLTNSALTGTFDFTDPDTAKFNRRFYRGLKL